MGAMRFSVHETMGRLLLSATLSLAATGCARGPDLDFDPPVVCRIRAPLDSRIFLIGDAGAPALPDSAAGDPDALVDPVLSALAADVRDSVEQLGADRTAVVVLGDNVYPAGMPPPGEKGHEHAARVLDAQVAAVGEARGFFTLGNHDWVQGVPAGWANARAQVDYLSAKGPNISVNPPDTCAGPDEVVFGDHVQFVFFDLWAAIYQIEHPDGPQAHCEPKAGAGRVAEEVGRVLGDTDERRAILVTHPPMLTSGPHGGYFPILEHLFPLRVFDRNLWIPLPVIGSLFPISRMLGVTDTDTMSANYTNYIEAAKELFSAGHPTLVAAGHEHSLQVHLDPTGVFHAVSGAGSTSKIDYVRDMKSDLMALAAPGYMRLAVYDDARMRLDVIAVEAKGRPDLVYSTCIP
jgi:hypothetical protein